MPQNYLFLCAVGQNRSPTAAQVARGIANKKQLDIEMFYGGFDCLVPILCSTEKQEEIRKDLSQYQRIFVMEPYMRKELQEKKLFLWRIDCLFIEDEYSRNDPVLMKLLKGKLEDLI